MIVIGDAVHAPSPTAAQGASLAIGDAVQLGKCLWNLPDTKQAFAAVEQARRPRVEGIIKPFAAQLNGTKTATGLQRIFRDLMLPRVLSARSKKAKWVYGYHIDWGVPE